MFAFEVTVETKFLERQSNPIDLRFIHTYEISILNSGSIPAQLMYRHWEIEHGDDRTEKVSGEGVIGKQPWIHPRETYVYSSFTVIQSPFGSMSGYYEFRDAEKSSHRVQIPRFMLFASDKFIH